MRFEKYNPNPLKLDTGDCVVRAISKAAGLSWDDAYDAVAVQGKKMCMMPSTDEVWGAWLRENGFERHPLPDRCPDCYTVEDFAEEHSSGTYVLGTGSHAVAIVDGTIYDAWDSSRKIPRFYFEKKEKEGTEK